MDAASIFSSATVFYINEEYEEALKHCTCAVTLQDCAEYRSCRAATYLKLGKFTEALEDVEKALKFDPKSHMALYWRGIALFYLSDFGGAKLAFEESLRANPNAKAPRAIWVRKCDAELSGSTLPLGNVATEVSKSTGATTTAVPTKAPVVVEAPPVKIPSVNAPSTVVVEEVLDDSAPTMADNKDGLSASGDKSGHNEGDQSNKSIRREWYQSNTHVYVTIFAKNVQQESCKAEFNETTFSLAFPFPGTADKEYQLDLQLFDAIEPEACKLEVSKVKVELSLQKKVAVQWKDLEWKEEVVIPAQEKQASYPTSSQQKRDWSKVERDIEAEVKNDKPEGDEALNSLFRQIYDRADPETRRAMNKSFQTSGGTVLSTNWGEVARSDYEGKDRPSPPEGQEWRDWKKK